MNEVNRQVNQPGLNDPPESNAAHEPGQLPVFPAEIPPMRQGICALLDAALKRPGELSRWLLSQASVAAPAKLLFCTFLFALGYGLVMGSFSGGWQWALVPLKAVLCLGMSALACFPSLFIISALSGSRQSIGDTAQILAVFLCILSLLLTGFAPIAWVFSQSTQALSFMTLMHFAFFALAFLLSIRVLVGIFRELNRKSMHALRIWGLIFFVVVLQMCTVLRPMLGPADLSDGKKMFFLEHWARVASH